MQTTICGALLMLAATLLPGCSSQLAPAPCRDSGRVPRNWQPVRMWCQVDQPARITYIPRLEADPRMLSVGGRPSTVDVDWIVDENGHVEAEHVRVLGTNSADFRDAVTQLLPFVQCTPAYKGGQRVRQFQQVRLYVVWRS